MKSLQDQCLDGGGPVCGLINRRLFPVKLHIFLNVGALAGVMPFIVVYAKSLGISAGLAGVMNATTLIATIFLKFYLGALADKFRAVKTVLIQVILLQAFAHLALYTCIPPIESTDVWRPRSESNGTLFSADKEYRLSCSCNTTSQAVICSQTMISASSLTKCNFSDEFTATHCCVAESRDRPAVLFTWQFWAFFGLRIIAGGLASVSFSLTDAATFAILGEQKQLYGRQRLWGTIGWGGLAPLIGYVNEMFSTPGEPNYAPGFFIHFALTLIDAAAVCLLEVPEVNRSSKSILGDIHRLYMQPAVLFFTLCVFVHGTFMGPIWSYAFLYFQDLGASQSLLGLQLTVQCFVGELPVMFFAGWIIARLGFRNSVALAVGGTGVRLAVYSFGTDPWLMLPAEILHGLSFGLFYTAMTLYASSIAPKGTEASVQGIMSGMFEGAGIAVGTIVCGFLFDSVGKRVTMFCFTVYAFAFLILQVLVNLMLTEPSLTEDDVPAKKLPAPPQIQIEEASQVEQLLRGAEGSISRTDTDISELRDISLIDEHDEAVV